MQWIAMLTMLIDHTGLLFFPDEAIWRIIGRLAFPLYAYALVQGYRHTSSFRNYMLRLALIAVISQIPYQLVLKPGGLNVVATLLVSLLILKLLERIRPGAFSALLIALCCLAMEVLPFDYGAYGLLLVLIFKYARSSQLLLMHLGLNLIYLVAYGWLIQMASLVITLPIAYGGGLWRKVEASRAPAWLWRSFYPAHLYILMFVVYGMRILAP
ncbi:TraX family protein [Paenibacillus brevis]|uniref:Conjugal transfer protein TraX n=1 Tax=Paenibacillus brevis TaxID=2841508 RepID=A0ABS6FMY6_9BACL|nr:TraX family protein [Paenibacillus brevis]MBU5671519.1 conjugal transfer protein TraX [Paenibacillus brevis]